MNFLTHILISKALYRQLSKQMDLDPKAFSYGNIKPDLSPKCLRDPHLLENYLFIVANRSKQLIEESPQRKEFSTDLGVICHYICDFFCYYHLNNKIYHNLFDHLKYEIRLHFAFCSMKTGKKTHFMSGRTLPGRSVSSMIVEMRKEYMTKQKTYQRDIEYALSASRWACELISRAASAAAKPAAASASDLKAFYSPYRVSSE